MGIFTKAVKVIVFFLSAGALAQIEIDPVAVSPDKYAVQLDNEYVRVVEYRLAPGEKDNWHTHPAKSSYVVSGGTLRITTEAGKSFVVEEVTGSSTWFGAVGKHYGQNVGTTPVHILFTEIKQIQAGDEDLDKYRIGEK